MKINDRIVDGAESFIRNPRQAQLKHLLLGCPLIGGALGLRAYPKNGENLGIEGGFYPQA